LEDVHEAIHLSIATQHAAEEEKQLKFVIACVFLSCSMFIYVINFKDHQFIEGTICSTT